MTLAVVEPVVPSLLAQLAAQALSEHEATEHEIGQAQEAVAAAVSHAIRAGEALGAARDQVPAGQWMRWFEEHVGFAYKRAQVYMKLAAHKDVLSEMDQHEISIGQAYNYVRQLPTPRRGRGVRLPDEVRQEAVSLHKRGKSAPEISEILDVHPRTVIGWVNPKSQREALRRQRKQWQKRAQEKKAAERERNAKLAKKAGGNVAKGYADLRRAIEAIDQAQYEIDSKGARSALTSALGYLYRAEDDMGRAIRLEGEK